MTKKLEILEPQGMLDGVKTNELKFQVLDALRQDMDVVLIDLSAIDFMNSSAIGALVSIFKAVKEQGKEVHLCGLTDQVKMIFEITKMNRVFKPFSNREEFNAKFLDESLDEPIAQ
jgi:anti-sigma B factor antagonist